MVIQNRACHIFGFICNQSWVWEPGQLANRPHRDDIHCRPRAWSGKVGTGFPSRQTRNRVCAGIMLRSKNWSGMTIRRKVITL